MVKAAVVPTRERLVRTAARLFLERSYQAVGVNEICAVAGLPKGSLYHWFASKDDLAIAVIDHHAEALWALLDQYEEQAVGPVAKIRVTADAVDVFQRQLATDFGRVMGCPLGNLAVELSTTEHAAGQHVANVFDRWERRVAGHCRDAESVGLLADGVEPAELARALMATMQGMILMAKVSVSSPACIAPAMHRVIDTSTRTIRPA
jgi:TetR/AcrR family transcriptional regulator, transcriptional repressor for nem operon